MEFTLSSFSLSLLIFAVVLLLLAAMLFSRFSREVRWFGGMMISVAVWSACQGIIVGMSDLEAVMFVLNIEYLGIVTVPVFWLLFTLRFVGKDQWLTRKWIVVQFIFPVISLAMVWTNSLHHLHYQDAHIYEFNGVYGLLTAKGPWYIIHTTYFYLSMGLGVFLLFRRFRTTEGMYKKQTFIILLGTLVPWIANILVVFQVGPFNSLDPTPHAFMIACVIIIFGFYELRLFDLRPIARNKVVDSMKNGMLVLDRFNRVVDINPYMLTIVGKSSGQVTGFNFSKLGLDSTRWVEMVSTDKEMNCELEVVVGGKNMVFEATCKLFDQGKHPYEGRLILMKDITQYRKDQNRLEKQASELKNLNLTKDRLLSILSHDLKNPLGSLTQFLDMVQSGWVSDQEFRNMLPEFSQNIKHVSGFIENLLEWAKSQISGEHMSCVEFNIGGEIEKVISLFGTSIEKKKVSVSFHSPGKTLVYADQNMIQLVIRNLLSNAIKFCEQDGEIEFYLSDHQDNVEVIVKDSGVGIPQENLKKIFSSESFTTFGTNKEKGTGLGLMLSRDFVLKNRGEIWVNSTVGKGSSFHFTLPKSAPINPQPDPNTQKEVSKN